MLSTLQAPPELLIIFKQKKKKIEYQPNLTSVKALPTDNSYTTTSHRILVYTDTHKTLSGLVQWSPTLS